MFELCDLKKLVDLIMSLEPNMESDDGADNKGAWDLQELLTAKDSTEAA